MIGLDTGYFVRLVDGDQEAVRVWKGLVEGTQDACVSCVSLFELKRLGLKGAMPEHETLCEGIMAVCEVVWIDSARMLSSAAKLSHGLGMPAADSLILAGLLARGARTIYTTDRHLEAYRKKDVQVVNLGEGRSR